VTSLPRALCLLSLGCAALPAAGLAQQPLFGPASAGIGVEGRRYEYEQGYPVHAISQYAFPVAVLFPIGQRLTVDIGSAYATTIVRDSKGNDNTFSGFTDTQLRGSYVFGPDRVVASLMFNLPTGQETTSQKEFNIVSRVASNFLLFPVNSYGNGPSATGGVAVAVPAGGWNLGLAGSARVNGKYQPFSDPSSSALRYQPGVEGRIRGGADRIIGSSRLTLGVTLSTFSNDEFSGGISNGSYNPGTRLIGEASFTSAAGTGLISGYVWDYYRSAGGRSGPVATSNKENVFTVGASGGWPISRAIRLEPLAEARFWSPDQGSGQLYGAGVSLRCQLSPRAAFIPGGRLDFGSVKPISQSYSLTGWGFSALFRYNFH
jgi:hypothetical protein